jgi:hypothetical protein
MVQHARSNRWLKTINMTDLNEHLKKEVEKSSPFDYTRQILSELQSLKKSRNLHRFMTFIMQLNATNIQLWQVSMMKKVRSIIFQFCERK